MKFSALFSRLFKPAARADDASSKLRSTELEVRRLEAALAQAQAAQAQALADIRTKAYGDYLAASGRPAAFQANPAAALNQYAAEQSVAKLRPAAEIEDIVKANREGNLDARVKLAGIMYSGAGIRQDRAAALSLYAAAHRAGSAEATAELNRLAADAGTEQRIRGWAAFALDRHEEAAGLGNPAAAREIADNLRTSNPSLSGWWENRASELARQDHAADMAAREASPAVTPSHSDWAARTLFQRVDTAGWQHVVDARTTYRVAAHEDGGASFIRETRAADGSTIAEDTGRFSSIGEAADAAIRHAAERRDFRSTPATTAYAYDIATNAPTVHLESSMRSVPLLSERQISKLPDQPYEVIMAQQGWKPAEDMNLEHRAGYAAAMSLRPLGAVPEPTAAAEAEARASRWFNTSPAEIQAHARDLLDGETAGYKAGFADYLSRNANDAAPMAHLLGRMHTDGMGTHKDPAKAAEYFAMAEAGYRSTPNYPPERLAELAADRERAAAVGEAIHAQQSRSAVRLWDAMPVQEKETMINGMWSRTRGDPAEIKTGQETASAILALKTSAERIEAAREYMASDAHPVATRVGFLSRIAGDYDIPAALARDPRPQVQAVLASTMAEQITSQHYAKTLSHEPNLNRPVPPNWQNDYDRSDAGDYLYEHVRGIQDYGHTPAENADRIRRTDLAIAAAWEREAALRPLAPAEEAERQYAAAYVKHYELSDEPPAVTAASRERLAQIDYLNIAEDSHLERKAGLRTEARDAFDAGFALDHNRPVPPDWYTNFTSSERFDHRTAYVEQWAQSRYGMTAAENADRIRSEDLAVAAAWEHEASKRPLAPAEEAERRHAAAYVKHYDTDAQPPAVTTASPERLAALQAFAATETQRIEHLHQARQASAAQAPTQAATPAPEAADQAPARPRLGGEMKQESTLVAGIVELAAHTLAHSADAALDIAEGAAAKIDPSAKVKTGEGQAPAGEPTFEDECRQEQARRDQTPGVLWDPDVETSVRLTRAARAQASAEAARREQEREEREIRRDQREDARERGEPASNTLRPRREAAVAETMRAEGYTPERNDSLNTSWRREAEDGSTTIIRTPPTWAGSSPTEPSWHVERVFPLGFPDDPARTAIEEHMTLAEAIEIGPKLPLPADEKNSFFFNLAEAQEAIEQQAAAWTPEPEHQRPTEDAAIRAQTQGTAETLRRAGDHTPTDDRPTWEPPADILPPAQEAAKDTLAHLDREAAKQAAYYGQTPAQHANATDKLAGAQLAHEAADYPAIKHGSQRQEQLNDPEFVKQSLAEVVRKNQIKDPSHHDHYAEKAGPKPALDTKAAQRAEMMSTLNRASAPTVGSKLDSLLAQSQPATLHQSQHKPSPAGVLGGVDSFAAGNVPLHQFDKSVLAGKAATSTKPDAAATEAKAAQAAYADATKKFLADPQNKALAAEFKASCSRLQDTGGIEKIADASEKSRATAAAGMFKADQKDMANRQEIAKTLAPHFPPPKDHFEAELRAAHKDAVRAVETGNIALSQSAAARATAAGVGLMGNEKQYQAAKETGAVSLANQYVAKALTEKAPHLHLGPVQSHAATL
ncbi:MAG: hypothetical protein WCJ64_08700 [Rhodospirillaceae bacterium]